MRSNYTFLGIFLLFSGATMAMNHVNSLENGEYSCFYDHDGDGVLKYLNQEFVTVRTPALCTNLYDGAVVDGSVIPEYQPFPNQFNGIFLEAALRGIGKIYDWMVPNSLAQGWGLGTGETYEAGGHLPNDAKNIARECFDANNPKNNPYDGESNNCSHFATAMEKCLTDHGLDGTVTVTLEKNSFFGTGSKHALNDIHIDGKTYFLEPQTGFPVQLDLNGDGFVRTRRGFNTVGWPSEVHPHPDGNSVQIKVHPDGNQAFGYN